MQKTLEKILKIIIGITFFVPLLIFPTTYVFPFIVPKIIYFRSLVLVMLGLYLILLVSDFKKYRPRFSWINIAVLLFFASFVVSTFVGVDWYKSFWDNHERMLGTFTIFHYIVYYFIITTVVRDWSDWKWLMRTFLLAGSIVMFIGVLQKHVNPNLLLNRGSDRVSSTLGNSIYFSGYGMFLFFLGTFLAIKENLKIRSIKFLSMDASWFWFEIVVALLGIWGIFLGGTRGALVAFILGLFVLLAVYFFTLKEQKKLKQIVLIVVLLGVSAMGVLFINRNTNFVSSLPAVGRLLNTDISKTNTRVMAWGVALDAWTEKPIFGWGPNNYYYAFNKYYRAEFLEYGFTETWFDNAHSVIMNTLAVQGIVGLLLYISIFVLATICLSKRYKEGKIDVHVLAFGVAFLWTHFISVATVFDNPTSYLYFFFFLAFASVFAEKTKSENITKSNRDVSMPWTVFVSLLILLFIYSTDVNSARANKATLLTIRDLNFGRNYIEDYNRAFAIPSPHIDDIRNDTARIFGEIISQILKDQKTSNKWSEIQPFYDEAVRNLNQNLELHPDDIRVSIQLAQIKIYGAVAKQDTSFLIETEKILEDALILSPKRQQIQYMLAGVKENLHKYDEATKLLQDSIDNDFKIANGWQQLENMYKGMGEVQKALDLHSAALEKGIQF
ncbi:MAG: O-antigen ligase family protein [Candidatus Magasanikbacteria bacterium]